MAHPHVTEVPAQPMLVDTAAVNSSALADEFDLVKFLSPVRRHFLWIVLIFVLGVVATILVTGSQKPEYQADTRMLMGSAEGAGEFVPVSTEFPSLNANINNQVEVLSSTSFLQRVVEKRDLAALPEFAEAITEYRAAAERAAAGEQSLRSQIGSLLGLTSDDYEVRTLSDEEFVTLVLLENMSISSADRADVVSVSITASNPNVAADIANAIADEFLIDQLETRFEATERASQWLAGRLESLRLQVKEDEEAVARYSETAPGINQGTEEVLNRVRDQLVDARARVAELSPRVRRINNLVNREDDVAALAESVNSEVMVRLRLDRAQSARNLSDLRLRLRDAHPDVVAAQQELDQFNEQIRSEVRRYASLLQEELQIAQGQVRVFERELDTAREEANRAGISRIGLNELERQAESSRALYTSFLTRFQEIDQASDGFTTQDPVRIITRALPPTSPSAPNVFVNLALGSALSLAFAAAFVVLLEMMDRGVRSRERFESSFGYSLLASFPKFPVKKGDGGVTWDQNSPAFTVFHETVRSLRSAIAVVGAGQPGAKGAPKTVMITSSVPDEGKTTLAVAVARSAAMAGQKVLLIDADLRRPSVLAEAGVAARSHMKTLVHYFAGEAEPDELVIQDTESPMQMVTPGVIPGSPTDLLASDRFRALLKNWAEERYDLVVLDSSPVLPIADSRVLSRYVDGVIYVVRWAKTSRDAVRTGLRYLEAYRANIYGGVLNIADHTKLPDAEYGRYYEYYNKAPTRPVAAA